MPDRTTEHDPAARSAAARRPREHGCAVVGDSQSEALDLARRVIRLASLATAAHLAEAAWRMSRSATEADSDPRERAVSRDSIEVRARSIAEVKP